MQYLLLAGNRHILFTAYTSWDGAYIKVLRVFDNSETAERACAQLERDISNRVEEMLDAYRGQADEND